MDMHNKQTDSAKGLLYIISVYLIWGFLPAYWRLLRNVGPVTILAYRIVWAFIILFISMMFFIKPANLGEAVKDRKNIILFILAGVTLLSQWVFYILTIVTNHILELSLGYYIYPVIAVIFSRIFFGEKMNVTTVTAFLLALAGVLILILGYNKIPALGLGVAVSFALYSMIKKKIKVPSLVSTYYEMMFLLPFALVYIIYMESTGGGIITAEEYNIGTFLLLIGGGVFTCVTLLLFASGARRMSFSAIGFLQYMSPTMALILAVMVYKEEFNRGDWISFGFIWAAVIVYSVPAVMDFRRKRISA